MQLFIPFLHIYTDQDESSIRVVHVLRKGCQGLSGLARLICQFHWKPLQPFPFPRAWTRLLSLTKLAQQRHLILGVFCNSKLQELKGLKVAGLILSRSFGKGVGTGFAQGRGTLVFPCVWRPLVENFGTPGRIFSLPVLVCLQKLSSVPSLPLTAVPPPCGGRK